MIDTEAVYDICHHSLPSYTNLNRLIAEVISCLCLTMDFMLEPVAVVPGPIAVRMKPYRTCAYISRSLSVSCSSLLPYQPGGLLLEVLEVIMMIELFNITP